MSNIVNKTKRRLNGVIVSNKMQKTVVVRVDRTVVHPKYGKRYIVSRRYKAHCDQDMPELGVLVLIEESRPYSKDKRWRLVK